MKVIQIKGSNGSGKSTIAMQLLELEGDDAFIDKHYTVLPNTGWVLIGPYSKDRGKTSIGCDSIGKVVGVKAAILAAITLYEDQGYNILFEGMMISTIKSTFYNFLLELEESHDIEPLFVILRTTVDKCVERINSRGTRKRNLNVDKVRKKCEMVIRHAKEYDQKYVRWLDVDNIPLDMMAYAFQNITDTGKSLYARPGPEQFTYSEFIKLPQSTIDNMVTRYGELDEFLELDSGQIRRYVGKHVFEPEVIDRNEHLIPAYDPFSLDCMTSEIWKENAPRTYEFEVGYQTSSGNRMSLLVQMIKYDREDVPLMTDYEQVANCRDCRGSSGSCPGFAPRFDTLKPSMDTLYVMTVTMDIAWSLKYCSHTTIFMPTSYADLITVSYANRLLNSFDREKFYTLGVGHCPGRCKSCAVLDGQRCAKPTRRRYSMEATGIDCDWLHSDLYGEWLPWSYQGSWKLQTYMTRYGGVLCIDNPDDELQPFDLLEGYIVLDKSYVVNVPDVPELDMELMTIPHGVHAGGLQYVYDLEDV